MVKNIMTFMETFKIKPMMESFISQFQDHRIKYRKKEKNITIYGQVM